MEEDLIFPHSSILSDGDCADYQYEIIMNEIADFESALDDDHEVALKLCNFGYVNGQYSQLIQHISQINFLLTSVPKSDPNKSARRIGFKTESSSRHSSEADN